MADANLRAVAAASWHAYKYVVLLPSVCDRARRLRSPRILFKDFTQIFYRLGDYTVGDLSYLTSVGAEPQREAIGFGAEARRVKEGDILDVLRPGQRYTYQTPHSATYELVQLLAVCTGREKVVPTYKTSAAIDSGGRLSVQPMRVWRENRATTGGCYPPLDITAYFYGEPARVDVADLAQNFASLTGSLRSWSLGVSDTEGCVHLASAQLVKSGCELMDAGCPVLLLLQHLRAHGWGPAPGRVLHSLDGRTFSMSKLSRRREYLQVLVRWEELCREGMPSDEPLAYYSCLLAGHDVFPAAGAVAYRAILSGKEPTLRRELAAPVLPALPPPMPEDIVVPGDEEPALGGVPVPLEDESAGHVCVCVCACLWFWWLGMSAGLCVCACLCMRARRRRIQQHGQLVVRLGRRRRTGTSCARLACDAAGLQATLRGSHARVGPLRQAHHHVPAPRRLPQASQCRTPTVPELRAV